MSNHCCFQDSYWTGLNYWEELGLGDTRGPRRCFPLETIPFSQNPLSSMKIDNSESYINSNRNTRWNWLFSYPPKWSWRRRTANPKPAHYKEVRLQHSKCLGTHHHAPLIVYHKEFNPPIPRCIRRKFRMLHTRQGKECLGLSYATVLKLIYSRNNQG